MAGIGGVITVEQWRDTRVRSSTDSLSDDSSSSGDGVERVVGMASSAGSTRASRSDTDEVFLPEDDANDYDESCTAVSKSAKRRQRRQKLGGAIREAAVKALQSPAEKSVVSIASTASSREARVTLADLGFDLGFHGVKVSAKYPVQICTREPSTCNRVLDAVRPPALVLEQPWWYPPTSPSAAMMPVPSVGLGLVSTSPASSGSGVCEASARAPPIRVRMGAARSALGVCQLPQPQQALASSLNVPAAMSLMTSPLNVPAPNMASPQGVLAGMVSPDACALRSWLSAGGLPCSPSSENAARYLCAAAPELYED